MNAFKVLFDVCWCDFFVCLDVYGVFVVVECSLFFESGLSLGCFVSG